VEVATITVVDSADGEKRVHFHLFNQADIEALLKEHQQQTSDATPSSQ
jgi:hypothetical protein